MAQKRIDRSGNESEFTRLANLDANFDDLFDVMQVLDADYTFLATIAAQQLLNASPNGALNLPVGLYEFECMFDVVGTSATSGTFGFALGGSATIESQKWMSVASKATDATEVAPTVTYNVAANTALTANNTNTVCWAHIRGVVRLSAKGTLIPQVSFSTITGATIPTVKKNSFFRVKKLNQVYSASIIQPPLPKANNDTPFWS